VWDVIGLCCSELSRSSPAGNTLPAVTSLVRFVHRDRNAVFKLGLS
jgi:hypothetical protein